jgi:3-methyladenine DNA glycosylase/8-oxoguanine DNA glycosylase
LAYDLLLARRHLAEQDAVLGGVIDAVGECRLALRDTASPFLGLLRAIVYQQLSGKAAASIHARLLALFPDAVPTPAALLALPDETLRAAGLSAAKVRAAKDLAEKAQAGVVPALTELTAMSDEQIVERLVCVRGIGRWTVEMLLIFNLGRPDVLPLNDLGVRKGFMRAYGLAELPSHAALLARGQRWAPYRSVASWYLWRAAEQNP